MPQREQDSTTEITAESKWPRSLVFVRHGQTPFNLDKKLKRPDPVYKELRGMLNEDPENPQIPVLGKSIDTRYPRRHSNWAMPLTEEGERMAFETGQGLKQMVENGEMPMPDVIFLPSLTRNRMTLAKMIEGFPALADVKTVEDRRISEKDFGLVSEMYSDQYTYLAAHHEENLARLFAGEMAEFYQRYIGGENTPDMMDRMGAFFGMLIREYSNKNVMIVGNHLLLQVMQSMLSRMTPEEYVAMDKNPDPTNKPKNCSVTIFESDPHQGKQGKLVQKAYNLQLYKD